MRLITIKVCYLEHNFLPIFILVIFGFLGYCFFPWVEKGHSSNAGHIHLEGESAIITCDSGYRLLNNKSIITCEENGWSISPMCKQFSKYAPFLWAPVFFLCHEK